MNDRLLRVLKGEAVDRRPIWIMRQAGRYLPEYRAVRAQHSFEELCAQPELSAEVTLQPIARFPLDGAIVFADLMSPVNALGIDVRFDPGPVVARPTRTRSDVDAWKDPDPGRIAPEVMATLALVKQRLEGRATLLGFAGGPWSIAAYLVEGRGERGFPELRKMMYVDPDTLERVLDRLTVLLSRYLVRQVESGAQAVQLFETWSGLLSAADWVRLVKPRLRQVLDAVAPTGAPRILFLQDAPHLIEHALDLPVEGFSVDWRTDLPALRKQLSAIDGTKTRAIQGNLDPTVLLGGPEVTRRAAEALLASVPARGHVMNLGHGITPEAPIASVEALIEAVHSEATHSNAASESPAGLTPAAGARSGVTSNIELDNRKLASKGGSE